MLYDKDILKALGDRLKKKYPNFNIQVLLHLLQSTARPLGYPPLHDQVDSKYYLNLITKKFDDSKVNAQYFLFVNVLTSLYQIMVCFCYLQNTLGGKNIDSTLLALLRSAIEQREDTTDEERGAEKSLLSMLIDHPIELLPLIGTYYDRFNPINILEFINPQMNRCGTKQLKKVVNSLAEDQPAINAVVPTSHVLCVIQSATEGIQFLEKTTAKKQCQMIIGAYLLNAVPHAPTKPWVNGSPFLKAAYQSALQERGKNETKIYISIRDSELAIFSLFAKHSKATKLSAANKFLQVLSNGKNVLFTPEEHEALCDDRRGRLTKLYSRYKSITPI